MSKKNTSTVKKESTQKS